MPIDSRHPSYNAKIHRWRKQRDAFEGGDAVKARGETYLHKPGGFQSVHYDRYLHRAKWFPATARTIDGLSGAIFQKDAQIVSSRAFERDAANITLSGITLDGLMQKCVREILLMGRYGIFLDFSEEMFRPYWSGYLPESIINWDKEVVRGETILTRVVIHEEVEDKGKDNYEIKYVDQYRDIFINADGQCEVSIERDSEAGTSGGSRVQVENYLLERRGQPIDFIPFQFFGNEDLTPEIAKGPTEGLVDINYSYFHHSADYEHGLFLTGIPTPIVSGHEDPDAVMLIGALTAWILPNPDAKAYFMEYQGMGLESHERAMENDKLEMATLGARLLEQMPDTQETLGAVKLRHAGDTGSLKTLANLTSDGLTNLIRWHHWRAGETENPNDPAYEIRLNTDLAATPLPPQDILALMQVWQQGGISHETFLYNLQQGERLPPEVTIEDELRRVETASPARLPFPSNGVTV